MNATLWKFNDGSLNLDIHTGNATLASISLRLTPEQAATLAQRLIESANVTCENGSAILCELNSDDGWR